MHYDYTDHDDFTLFYFSSESAARQQYRQWTAEGWPLAGIGPSKKRPGMWYIRSDK